MPKTHRRRAVPERDALRSAFASHWLQIHVILSAAKDLNVIILAQRYERHRFLITDPRSPCTVKH